MTSTGNIRQWLIHKIGGFVLYPDKAYSIVVKGVNVKPVCIKGYAGFTQEDLVGADINYLREHAFDEIHQDVARRLLLNDVFVDEWNQNEQEGGQMEFRSEVWVLLPKDIRRIKKDLKKEE